MDEGHFQLDKLLNKAEQDLQKVEAKEKELQQLLRENERLKREYEVLSDKERKNQQFGMLKLQNKIKEDELAYLKDMERKMKQIVIEWKRSDDKQKVMKQAEALLFRKREKAINDKLEKKVQDKFQEVVGSNLEVGNLVKIKTNGQVGTLIEIRDKRGIVKLGNIPMNVPLADLILVKERPKEKETAAK